MLRCPPCFRPTRAALAGAVAALALAGAALPARAQAQPEAALKARLTLSLTRFAQWPEALAGADLHLCLAQRDLPTAQAFAELDGQLVNGRRVKVVKVPPVAGCHVLFVHASAERVPDLVRAAGAGTGAVLIVGDAEGLLAQGGMVELVAVDDAIRFDIHTGALRRARLSLSSQVLKLARQVRE